MLSFGLADPGALKNPKTAVFLGEIYISLDTARVQAKPARRPFGREVAHLMIHGLLHLLGYDHHTPAATRRMRAMERRVMGALRARIASLSRD